MQIFVLEEGECQGNQGSMHHFFAREGTLDAQTMHLHSLHYGGGGGGGGWVVSSLSSLSPPPSVSIPCFTGGEVRFMGMRVMGSLACQPPLEKSEGSGQFSAVDSYQLPDIGGLARELGDGLVLLL